ncbi:hypothetical protein D9611_009727 [Ephemerocybe angulata]|uniref:Conserved Oligomeric Golgi complex subunit 6 C-terminal domain-containing protein n=1 Tax=Ephemerocybe angulata TaxID=980116 RepID=A0A8H5C844_9AGAR|nr:hypothetical protein D9611_009727 [Tulosesus angulatus]
MVVGNKKAGEKQKAGLGSEFGEVLDVAIDPVVESVIKGGEEKDKLRPRWNASVWIVNCLTYILSVVEPFSSFTQEKQDGIKTLLDTRVAALIEEHTTSLLDESGLFGVYQTIEHPPNTSEPLSHFRETSPALRALHQFCLFLSSPTVPFLVPARRGFTTLDEFTGKKENGDDRQEDYGGGFEALGLPNAAAPRAYVINIGCMNDCRNLRKGTRYDGDEGSDGGKTPADHGTGPDDRG